MNLPYFQTVESTEEEMLTIEEKPLKIYWSPYTAEDMTYVPEISVEA